MSNLADFLTQITVPNSAAVNLVGNALGTLADLGGGIGAASDLIGLFISDNTKELLQLRSKLEEIKTAINENFAALHAEQRAEHLLDRLRDLDPADAAAQTIFDGLKAIVGTTPPVSEEFKLQQIGVCLNALNVLDHDDKFLTVFADEVYYGEHGSDMWTGEMTPEANADGLVFSDRYILPFFMMTLYRFMTVAAALKADYALTFREPLRRFTTRLLKVHDTSMQGIIAMRKPTRSAINQSGFGQEVNAWQGDWYELHENESYQPYGVVYVYSGFRSVSFYPDLPLPRPPDRFLPEQFVLEVIAKLNLAIRREWKKAYVAIGLHDLRDTINNLRRLTGDPPLPGVDPSSWWSLREIYGLLEVLAPVTDSGMPNFSAFRTLSVVAAAAGLPPGRPLSWRGALGAALASATDFRPTGV